MSQSIPVYQVSDLVNEMRKLMETSYPEIWIEGELSSLSTPASGHLYFSLKDETSQLRCAMFRSRVSVNRYRAKAGDLVRVRAKISVYPARGDLQCIVQYIEDAGEGMLQRRFEDLQIKLNEEGLFNADHKLPIPSFARHIGLITSPTGAAVNDILSTLARRSPGIPVTLYPAVVQGETAAASLIQAISNAVAHKRCDVIILARGGGSLEDLWCFNDEALARAIYQCPIPIVSAVGHEIDMSIADYVADLRAPTPTAAAELLSPDNKIMLNQLLSVQQRLYNSIGRYLEQQAQRVDSRYRQLQHPKSKILLNQKQLRATSGRLTNAMQSQFRTDKSRIDNQTGRLQTQQPLKRVLHQLKQTSVLTNRLRRAQSNSITQGRQKFESLGSQLQMVSPLATLQRGFSITRNQQDEIIRDARNNSLGDNVKIQLKSGSLQCEIQRIIE
jgi:exodeoxyribonuclease VII large subunit